MQTIYHKYIQDTVHCTLSNTGIPEVRPIVKKDLVLCQKRPILCQKETCSMPKETYSMPKRDLAGALALRPSSSEISASACASRHIGHCACWYAQCQKRPIHMAKEKYSYRKRDLFIWQKRRSPRRDSRHIRHCHNALISLTLAVPRTPAHAHAASPDTYSRSK